MALEMDLETYVGPQVRDLGTLSDVTADFDLSFHGSVAKLVTLAAVSAPGTNPNPNPQPVAPGGGGGGGTQPLTPSGGGGVQNNVTSGGGGGGSPQTPSSTPDPSTPDPGTTDPISDRGNPGGGVANDRSSGGSGSPSVGDAAGAGAGSESGSLPFTGYAAMLVAGVGAALAGVGAATRSKLRLRRDAS